MMLLLLACTLPGALLVVTAWNAWAAPRLPAPVATDVGTDGSALPRASLLIPARNEADALGMALPAAVRHGNAAEVLVLDDESTDGTGALVRRVQHETDGRVRLLPGLPLPPGWLGKNWACHQLAGAARGEVLIFCDADVVLTADAVAGTVALLERTGADVLTALPRQRYSGWWDRATIPLLLHLPLLGTLPLALVPRLRRPSVVFGNGQWLAFRRTAYERIGGHAAARGEIVEDMALVRRAKQLGLRVLPVLAPDALEVRMYRRPGELFAGFAKNLYPLLGRSPVRLAAALLGFGVATVLPLALAFGGTWPPLVVLAAVRLLQARLTRAPLSTVLLHPAGVVLACAAVIHSALTHATGTVTWKSRSIEPVSGAAANT